MRGGLTCCTDIALEALHVRANIDLAQRQRVSEKLD
jgi:hypothetical protein